MQASKKSTASLLISLLLFASAAFLLITAFFMAFSAFLPLMTGESIQAQGAIFGFVFGFEALILFTAAYLCFQKYLEHSASEKQTRFSLARWHILILVIGAGLALLIGYFIADNDFINWLFLPILTIPAVLLPIGLLLGFGAQKIELGPRWRVWGIFGLGMTLGPFILVIIEIAMLFIAVILIAFYYASNPVFSGELINLANQVNLLQNDPQAIVNLFIPYALEPGAILFVVSFFALIVPFTEELIKPIGVWLFAAKLDSPAQGFALGALSGAAYALIETFGSSGQTTEWASLISTRIGTSLLHITSTALMGWAIASVWRDRKLLKFFAVYLSSSILHGAWNTSVIMYSYSILAKEYDPSNALGLLTPYMLAASIALTILLFTILILMNRKLRQTFSPDNSEAQPTNPTGNESDQPGVGT